MKWDVVVFSLLPQILIEQILGRPVVTDQDAVAGDGEGSDCKNRHRKVPGPSPHLRSLSVCVPFRVELETSCLFADISGFTKLAERLSPERVSQARK